MYISIKYAVLPTSEYTYLLTHSPLPHKEASELTLIRGWAVPHARSMFREMEVVVSLTHSS